MTMPLKPSIPVVKVGFFTFLTFFGKIFFLRRRLFCYGFRRLFTSFPLFGFFRPCLRMFGIKIFHCLGVIFAEFRIINETFFAQERREPLACDFKSSPVHCLFQDFGVCRIFAADFRSLKAGQCCFAGALFKSVLSAELRVDILSSFVRPIGAMPERIFRPSNILRKKKVLPFVTALPILRRGRSLQIIIGFGFGERFFTVWAQAATLSLTM